MVPYNPKAFTTQRLECSAPVTRGESLKHLGRRHRSDQHTGQASEIFTEVASDKIKDL